jgi:hypothetical protein
MGSARVTYDVDLCYRRTPANLERLARALRTLSLTLRGAPADLKFRLAAWRSPRAFPRSFQKCGRPPSAC